MDVNESLGDMVLDLGLITSSITLTLLQHVDVVIDTTGNPSVIGKRRRGLNPSGRLILVGQPAPKMGIAIPNAVSMFEGSGKTITTQGGMTNPTVDIPRYIDLAGKLDYETFTLTHIHWMK